MPNWCSNSLRVLGDEDAMKKMLEEIPMFSLGAVIPMPEELASIVTGSHTIDSVKVNHWRWAAGSSVDVLQSLNSEAIPIPPEEIEALREKYGAVDWYDWCISRWGTKWDVEPVEWYHIGAGYETVFDTAWAPPRGVIVALSERYPVLRFELSYSEAGGDFAGTDVWVAGVELEDQAFDIRPSEHTKYESDGDNDTIDDVYQQFLTSHNLWIGG